MMISQKQLPDPGHFVFIVNPYAGLRHSQKMVSQIELSMKKDPRITYEVILTEKTGHAGLIAEAAGKRYQENAVIFACGGDGTANEVVNGLYGTKSVMGILPIGTSNDFCKNALSTLNLDELIERLPQPLIKPIDLVSFNDRICINILSLGLDSIVQEHATKYYRKLRLPGSLLYLISIVSALFTQKVFKMRYELKIINKEGKEDTITSDSSFILAAICNGQYYGGGFNPAPGAILDDGRLDVCIVDALPLLKMLNLIPKYKKGTHISSPAVKTFSAVSGRITASGKPLPGNADGELFREKDVSFKILKQALPFAFY